MNKTYLIGDFAFQISYPENMIIPENFQKFEKNATPEYTYEIALTDRLPSINGKELAKRPDISVYSTPDGEARLIGSLGSLEHYACYKEQSATNARISLVASKMYGMSIDPMFVSLLALEKRLLAHNSLVLHTAYIVHNGQAILFSAPSETGKSTQASLWEQYRGSHIVNGDRGLLQKKDGKWTANGWPVCGTSEICNIESYPIRAIVMLSQAKEDFCELLPQNKSFTEVFSQITINRWNRSGLVKAMDLIEDLIQSVPVFHLGCTISENAVICLEKALNSI